MSRFLIILGLSLILLGLIWPVIVKSGLGRLPGDIVLKREHVTLYFPLATSILLSLLLTGVLWLLRK